MDSLSVLSLEMFLLQAKLFKYEKGRKEGSQCTVIRRLRQSQASTGDDMNNDIYAAGI